MTERTPTPPQPQAIYVWLVPSEHVLEQPGSWRIRKWDTAPFPEANYTLAAPSETNATGPRATITPVSNAAGTTTNAGTKGDSRYPNSPVRREGEIPAPATYPLPDKKQPPEYEGDPKIGYFSCACVFYRSGEFEEAKLVKPCNYHAHLSAIAPTDACGHGIRWPHQCDDCERERRHMILKEVLDHFLVDGYFASHSFKLWLERQVARSDGGGA